MEETNRRYVVGVDGSAESREALRWASRLAHVLGGEIVAVHARGLVECLDSDRADVDTIMRRQWCACLHDETIPFRAVVREGSPLDVLPAVAAEERAALLVVGSRGIGAAPALALGSTSLHLLQCSTVPVLVVPPGEESRRHLALRRVLVAVDGATRSDAGVAVAAWLAAGFNSRIDLVHAVEEVPVFPLGHETAVSVAGEVDAPARARSMLQPIQRDLGGRGVPTHVRVTRGPATEVLRSTAAAIDADLVVLVSSHMADVTGSLLGSSVSRRVAAVVHRPVLVVPEIRTPRVRSELRQLSAAAH